MEQDNHIEVPAKVGCEVIPQGFDEPEPLKGDAACGLGSTLEVFRIVYHILLHHLDERTASVDDDGFILPLGGFDIGLDLIKRGADGSILPMLGLHPAHTVVGIDGQNLGSRLGNGSLPYTGASLDDERHLLVRKVEFVSFFNHRCSPLHN